MRKEMQTLLDDIELDIQELKYLMQVLATDANPTLKVVAKRNIQQMRARLDALQKLLDETPVEVVAIPEAPVVPVVIPEPAAAPEPVKPIPVEPVVVEITKPVEIVSPKPESTPKIFGGNTARMNEVIHQLGAAPSLEKALELFSSTVNPDEENETVVDFIELLKKYFS